MADALKRELKEEIGLEKFTVKKIVDIATMPDGERSVYILTFLIEPVDFKEPKLSNEHAKYAWVTLDTLDQYSFYNETLKNRVRKGLKDESL